MNLVAHVQELFESLLHIIPAGPESRHGDDTELLTSTLSASFHTRDKTVISTGQ
jgi:hypothetical protein